MTLFTTLHPQIALTTLDLIFCFGSGYMRGSFADPAEPVSDEFPLCRTQQLLLCAALVLTRQVLYVRNNAKTRLEFLPSNFEDHLERFVGPRFISETIQIENYIFGKQDQSNDGHNMVNDLKLRMNVSSELAKIVH
jgi:hypothetical protein